MNHFNHKSIPKFIKNNQLKNKLFYLSWRVLTNISKIANILKIAKISNKKLKYYRKGSIRKWVALTSTHLSLQQFNSTRHFHIRASPYQSTKSITETRHSITNPSLRHVTTTQIRHFDTNPSLSHESVSSTQQLTDFCEDDGFWRLQRSDPSVEVTS